MTPCPDDGGKRADGENRRKWRDVLAKLRRSLRSGHFRFAGVQILVVAIVLLISGMLMMSANVASMEAHSVQVDRANAFLLQLAEVEKDTLGVEFSLRGRALTGLPQFRDYYLARRDNLRAAIRELKRLAVLCARRRPQVDALGRLMEARIAALEPYAGPQGIDARAYARLIVDPGIRRQRYEIERQVAALKRASLDILNEQKNEAERKVKETDREAFAIVAAAFLLAVLGVLLNRAAQPDQRRGS